MTRLEMQFFSFFPTPSLFSFFNCGSTYITKLTMVKSIFKCIQVSGIKCIHTVMNNHHHLSYISLFKHLSQEQVKDFHILPYITQLYQYQPPKFLGAKAALSVFSSYSRTLSVIFTKNISVNITENQIEIGKHRQTSKSTQSKSGK